MKTICKALVLGFSLWSLNPIGAMATGKVASKATVEVTALSQSDSRVQFTFKTIPIGDLVVNKEGPWKLEIISSGKLQFDKKELKRADWKEDIAGFSLTSAPAKTKSEKIKYKLVAFVCTKDKSQCFREVLQGDANVKW
jgi:hypothetical protein